MGKNLYGAIKEISQFTNPCLVCFSTGRDSVVMLDLMMKYYKGEMKFVYFYFVPNLSYKEKLLRYYETKYNIKIERKPYWVTLSYMLGKEIKQGEYMKWLRSEYNISYIVMGTRRCETLHRSIILKNINGVDERNHYFYPVVDWTQKQVSSYVKMHNLPIGEEYKDGFKHDLSTPDHLGLLYIKNQYPEDYEKIISTFPNLEAGVKKLEFFRGQ